MKIIIAGLMHFAWVAAFASGITMFFVAKFAAFQNWRDYITVYTLGYAFVGVGLGALFAIVADRLMREGIEEEGK